jgi:hypothetical protein
VKELVCVLIPIMNPTLTPLEKKVIDHALQALRKYSFIFLVAEDSETTVLEEAYSQVDRIAFPAKYFESRATLGSLFLMEAFYERFSWAEFVLIHELNSWVVKDELHYWCKQGYDYLRADVQDKGGKTGFINRLRGLTDAQKAEMDEDFNFNGLALCHVDRAFRALKGKKSVAYSYRHHPAWQNKDCLFWELEANRFLPTLRRPTRIVQNRFANNISSTLPVPSQDRERWPFGLTGVNSSNIEALPYFS